MNHESDLPPELAALEQTLAAAGPGPDPALRQRVLARVERDLRDAKGADFWHYAAAVAAAFLLLWNVSFSVAYNSPRTTPIDPQQVAALCGQVEKMQLGLSPEEIRRQCLLMAAGSQLVPCMRPYGSAPTAWLTAASER
jgi:hypothetical protein